MKYTASLAVALLSFISIQAQAESLDQAWQLALEHDAGLAAASADLDSARSTERAARAERMPSLGASAGYTRFDAAPQFAFDGLSFSLGAPIFAGDDFVSSSAQIKLPLYTGGRVSAEIDAAKYAASGASDMERVARFSLRLDVAQSYIGVLRAKHLLQTAEARVASLAAHSSDVGSMVNRELVARSDLLAARVALANAEQQRVRAANDVVLAYAAYNRRLGEPLDRMPELEDSVPMDTALAAQPLNSLIERAVAQRGELGAQSALADSLAQQSRAQQATLLPQFALSVGYTYVSTAILDRKDFATVGVGVTWNLFDAGQVRQRSAALRSQSVAARHRAEDLRTRIELEVRRSWLSVREARSRIAASRDAVAQAEENLRITRELYGTGLGTNTQVLDAVTLQLEAANNHENAVLDHAFAVVALARAVESI